MTADWESAGGGVGIRDASHLAAEDEKALEALRAQWKHAYDTGPVTVADENGPVLLWVAFRLEKRRPKPLLGFTVAALEAAIRDDWGEQP